MTNKLLWIGLAFLAGAVLPLQGGFNAKLSKLINSPIHSSMISFVVGTFVLITYILVTRQPVSWHEVKSAPGFVWLAGALGAFYVTIIILAFPRLGPALTFGLVVAGQMIVSVLLDHFNILVAQQQPINIWRIIGIVMVLTGVVIIRKF